MSEKKVLCVGLTCLDIVTDVASFPVEDTDQRSIGQEKVSDFLLFSNIELKFRYKLWLITYELDKRVGVVVEMQQITAQHWHS